MTEADKLYETLEKIQTAKGYLFNQDKTAVMELLESLLVNKQRYGYMSCPCRLAAGDREADMDILCPCRYRDDDLSEFGACYCALYVTKEWNEEKIEHQYVPERRPPEKQPF